MVVLPGIAAAILMATSPVGASVASELAFHQGVVAYEQGQLAEAQEQFEIVLASDPEDATAIHYLGLIADDQGRKDEAIQLFRRAIALAPDDADLQFDLGAALLEAGRNQEALETFEGVLEREPDRARAISTPGSPCTGCRTTPPPLPAWRGPWSSIRT